jgi:hypothetical protein
MRYWVKSRLKPGREAALKQAIESGTLGQGSVAGDEYLRNMSEARCWTDGTVRWVEICFCDVPLDEERAYWEEFFDLVSVQDAHARHRCRDVQGDEPWACCDCDCTDRLEAHLRARGRSFREVLDSPTETGSGRVGAAKPCRTRPANVS